MATKFQMTVMPGVSFNKANNQHLTATPTRIDYGPRTTAQNAVVDTQNEIFDTWHPNLDINQSGEAPPNNDDPPPYRPVDTGTGTPIPVKAIQITIRFYDVASNQMKQLTLQMSLLD